MFSSLFQNTQTNILQKSKSLIFWSNEGMTCLGARDTLVTHRLKLLYHKWIPHSSDMEGWMLLPHCLWDCSGRAAIRICPAGSVPWGRSCWFFKYLKNRLSSIANANICDGIDTSTNNLTWHSCIHSSIPPSTWDLSDGEKSSQSWLVDIGQLCLTLGSLNCLKLLADGTEK